MIAKTIKWGLSMVTHRPILLIDDDTADAMMLKRAFEYLNLKNPLVHVINGIEGLEYLKSSDYEKPRFILLDSNMPKMNGIKFLKIAKSDDSIKNIPIIALTTSDDRQHINESFMLGIAGYFIKPVGYEEFVEAIRTLYSYWYCWVFVMIVTKLLILQNGWGNFFRNMPMRQAANLLRSEGAFPTGREVPGILISIHLCGMRHVQP